MNKKNGLSKWYPSEDEPIRPFQKQMLGNIKTNARKAEFMVEDLCIKMHIDAFFITRRAFDKPGQLFSLKEFRNGILKPKKR